MFWILGVFRDDVPFCDILSLAKLKVSRSFCLRFLGVCDSYLSPGQNLSSALLGMRRASRFSSCRKANVSWSSLGYVSVWVVFSHPGTF